jgi:hypothetical protein
MIVMDAGGMGVSPGTALAEELAHRYRKPLILVDLGEAGPQHRAALWLRVQQARHGGALTLAIGGPRESEAPGIYTRAAAFIGSLLD